MQFREVFWLLVEPASSIHLSFDKCMIGCILTICGRTPYWTMMSGKGMMRET